MGKWNCVSCGLNLEDKRHLAEFPLGDTTIYCRDCAKAVTFVTCKQCKRTVPAKKSWRGQFCSEDHETRYYTTEHEVR